MLSTIQAQINGFWSSTWGKTQRKAFQRFSVFRITTEYWVTHRGRKQTNKQKKFFIASHQILKTNIPCCIYIYFFSILVLAAFLFITVCSEHFKAPYGLDCGSVLARSICKSEACCTFGFYRWIIFTGDMLRSRSDSEPRDFFFLRPIL